MSFALQMQCWVALSELALSSAPSPGAISVKNLDFLFKNLHFLFKNLHFIIKHSIGLATAVAVAGFAIVAAGNGSSSSQRPIGRGS